MGVLPTAFTLTDLIIARAARVPEKLRLPAVFFPSTYVPRGDIWVRKDSAGKYRLWVRDLEYFAHVNAGSLAYVLMANQEVGIVADPEKEIEALRAAILAASEDPGIDGYCPFCRSSRPCLATCQVVAIRAGRWLTEDPTA